MFLAEGFEAVHVEGVLELGREFLGRFEAVFFHHFLAGGACLAVDDC